MCATLCWSFSGLIGARFPFLLKGWKGETGQGWVGTRMDGLPGQRAMGQPCYRSVEHDDRAAAGVGKRDQSANVMGTLVDGGRGGTAATHAFSADHAVPTLSSILQGRSTGRIAVV